MLEELLIPDLRQSVVERDWRSLAEFCNVLHPTVIARTLSENGDNESLLLALASLPMSPRTEIFEYLPDETQDEIVSLLPKPDLAKMIEVMSHDERVDLVKRMSEQKQQLVMPLVARADREDILRLARHEEGTAGSIMTTDYAALPAEVSVGDAINRLRREAPNRETIYYVYVIDAERRLIGFVSLKDLILAWPGAKVGDVMRADVVRIRVETDVEEVAKSLASLDLIAIPVVDEDEKLVGIITHDDVIDVVIEEATEDVHLMGAVQPLEFGYIDTSVWQTMKKRVVWLAALFVAEMFGCLYLSGFEAFLAEFAILVSFMPVIIATGGNSGSQTASLVTRALALGEISAKDWLRIAKRELLSGVLLGAGVGTLGVAAVVVRQAHLLIAVVLVLALIAVVTIGSLVGALMPLFFKRVGLDPAISSGPFVSMLVDIVGIFIYISIAFLVLAKW